VGKQLLQEKEELLKITCTLKKVMTDTSGLSNYLTKNSYFDLGYIISDCCVLYINKRIFGTVLPVPRPEVV
jgi:hypothetical protein